MCVSLSLSGPVSGHQHFDVASRIKAIQLVDQLKHGTLHFIGASISVTVAGTCERKHNEKCLNHKQV